MRIWFLMARVAGAVLPWVGPGGSLPAAERTAAAAPPVELPPMMVEESVTSAPWFYVEIDGTEFLSRCSPATTRHLVGAWLEKMQLLRALVPEGFLGRMDVPAVFVLYAQDLKQTVSAEIQRELQALPAGVGGPAPEGAPRGQRVGIAPNMRLTDRDMHASIAYIDEVEFDAAALNIAPNHVRFLLQARVTRLPGWVVEGIERAWRGVDSVVEPLTLHPLVWNTRAESEALAQDPTRPRALLPAGELFVADATRGERGPHPRRQAIRASQQELFFRWAMTTGAGNRAAYWHLADHAAGSALTEEVFEAIFGFDFAELRDRLSDYLPRAVQGTTWIDPGRLPAPPPFEVERATPGQIARVRGEWERLAIGHVQRRLPQVREPYVAQARRTLRRAYAAGDRDPRLLATMGLCEIDAGNEAGALEFLTAAAASGVVRPRAYYELARLRLAALRKDGPEGRVFSFTEIAPVIEALRRGLRQSPPLPEAVALLAEAWACCELTPQASELAELEAGARLFTGDPAVGLAVAWALARHGKKTEAAALLGATPGLGAGEGVDALIARLRAELTPTGGRAAGGEGSAGAP